jgi:hypothetical protein
MAIYSSTKTENVKATAASTLSRLLRSSPGMMEGVLERWGRHLLLTGVLACECGDKRGVYCQFRQVQQGAGGSRCLLTQS